MFPLPLYMTHDTFTILRQPHRRLGYTARFVERLHGREKKYDVMMGIG
jgi:hypothetical protein